MKRTAFTLRTIFAAGRALRVSPQRGRLLALTLALALTGVWASLASAHRASDSFVALAATSASSWQGHWDVALSDLSYALALDSARPLSWGELRAHEAEAARLLREGLRFESARRACSLQVAALALVRLSDGLYARLPFQVRCPEAAATRVSSQLLAQVDRDHRTLLRLGAGDQADTHVLALAQPALALPAAKAARVPLWRVLSAQIGRGLSHIFEGTDHIAFLLVLLLPALFRKKSEQPGERTNLSRTLLAVAKVVTAFTLAHSLTLSLAAFGLVRTSADVIEPAIATSVALAAFSNLLPRPLQEGALLAFALGLLHGFGFSSALSDAGLSGSGLLAALLGFNLGVEFGQLAIVALFVPLSLLLCRVRWLRERVLFWGSAMVLALALFWVFDRLQTG